MIHRIPIQFFKRIKFIKIGFLLRFNLNFGRFLKYGIL
ncbi:hypothetical protein LEP1GSC043_3277 [Leptospira weilii str. Ecochallenge]|nr:hypothetical protein LEP1GSC051_3305 [Leptospira sp. P2653]EMM70480.1 hypothetical protein LEP1GSC038_1259 [Leptospira weilii str. 2006001855]EMN44889.1 hypothetical protein LEP1GSC086_0225 [Leptospira weilii str. LNT 1234]EMY14888.1 hypothetical protein LEP1GSC043_3277 [Leptospira weilii str. Ecochallenge]EQA63049.1 hypothetical protein LEP1GSC062_3702 [Leptospira alexanderi serovar Manhao 3 str. L 60]